MTKSVLVTGARGFLGRNLVSVLATRTDVVLTAVGRDSPADVLALALKRADVVYHLAGVNRPEDDVEFHAGNVDLTRSLLAQLSDRELQPTFVLASSVQAERDNPYGRSKRAAEQALLEHHETTGAPVCIYRFPNLFGKWSRPNYNTVVATFCHNLARDLEISVADPGHELELAYVDDVVAALIDRLDAPVDRERTNYAVERTFRITVGDLAARIRQMRDIRVTLQVPDFADDLTRFLYATYISFLPSDGFAYPVKMHSDDRGNLFELLKSPHFGQVFVSTTRPGITRGNHHHATKVEKFCLIRGAGTIRFRPLHSDEVISYQVSGDDIRVVDIPTGYTHSIENTGKDEMIVLFWANEIFDRERPDTVALPVIQ